MAYSVSDTIGGFDNSGTFKRVCNWTADKNAGIKILSERMDAECDNFAGGFNNCITRDMKGKPYTHFDFNGYTGTNLATDLTDPSGAVNVATFITDPTRLFYDTSTIDNQVWLYNDYMGTGAVNINEGYHFYFVLKSTITDPDFRISFAGSGLMSSLPVVGPDGAAIPSETLLGRGIYSCVIFLSKALEPYVLKVCVLNAISGGGGGGGGGGRVDQIKSDDDYIDVNDDNMAIVRLSLDTSELEEDLAFVNTINGDSFIKVSDGIDDQTKDLELDVDQVKASLGNLITAVEATSDPDTLKTFLSVNNQSPTTPKVFLKYNSLYDQLETNAINRGFIYKNGQPVALIGQVNDTVPIQDWLDRYVCASDPVYAQTLNLTTTWTIPLQNLSIMYKHIGNGPTLWLHTSEASTSPSPVNSITVQAPFGGTHIIDGAAPSGGYPLYLNSLVFNENCDGATFILKNIKFGPVVPDAPNTLPIITINCNCTVIVDETCGANNYSMMLQGVDTFIVRRGRLMIESGGYWPVSTILGRAEKNGILQMKYTGGGAHPRNYFTTDDGGALIIAGDKIVWPNEFMAY